MKKIKATLGFRKESGQNTTSLAVPTSLTQSGSSATTKFTLRRGHKQSGYNSDQATTSVSAPSPSQLRAAELESDVSTMAMAGALDTPFRDQPTLGIYNAPPDNQLSLQRVSHQILPESIENTEGCAGPSQRFPPDQRSASFDVNLPRSGLFAGTKNVDASHGVFNRVGRDQFNVSVEIQKNDVLLLDKLPHVKSAGFQSSSHKTCLTGTRIEELRRIEEWEADYEDKRVYWLNGLTGCGKSTVAKTFAERSFAKGRLGASFFCSRDFGDRRDISLIFSTLAYDLACRFPKFKTALIPIISSNPNVGHALPAVQLENLLIRPLKLTGLYTTIVIEALDECEDKDPTSEILSLLGQHIDAIPHVKFFITGRPEPRIRSGFRVPLLREHTEVFLLHEVDKASVNQDIELYLRTQLSEIVAGRSHWDLTVPWPTDKEITVTIKKCSGLFIVASVIVKFVSDPHRNPQDRLKIIISDPDSTIHEGKSGVDVTYHQIFVQSFEDVDMDDTDLFDQLRLVVGSIVLALDPLSCADLATILDISPESVWIAIRSLHSVLIVPDSKSKQLQICHKSLADFLTDSNRCKDKRFHIEPSIYHLELGMSCLKLMKKKLKKNICNLPPYAVNENIRDLGERREKYIGGGLEYACRSWTKHIRCSASGCDNTKLVFESLEYFFKHNLLSWLEVLSIIGDVGCAIHSLHDVRGWLKHLDFQDTNLFNIVNDSERFVLRFFDVIEVSAPHIYNSALLWSPASSLVRALYQDQISCEVKLLNAIDESWDACIRTVRTQQHALGSIIFSHKDDLIAVAEYEYVEVFEVITGRLRATFKSTDNSGMRRPLAFSLDDSVLAIGYDEGIIHVRDLQTGGLVNCLEGHTDSIESLIFSPCGTMIASCSTDQTVRIWNVPAFNCRCILEGHSARVQTVCWAAPGSQRVVSGSDDGTVKVWDISDMRCLETFFGHDEVRSLVSSDDSPLIASVSRSWTDDGNKRIGDTTIEVIDVRTGDVIRTIQTDDDAMLIRFSHHDQVMYTSGSRLVIWDLSDNASVSLFEFDGLHAAISSDGTCIASLSRLHGDLKIWRVDSANQYRGVAHPHPRERCAAFSGDGRLIASGGSDGSVRLWDPTSGLCLETLHGHSYGVNWVTFSPDSRLCISSSHDGLTRVWDAHTCTPVSTFSRQGPFVDFGCSPDCKQIVTRRWAADYSEEPSTHHIELWELATGECLASTEVEIITQENPDIAFGLDGTSVVLKHMNSVMSWKISPATTSNHKSPNGDDDNDHLSLLMVFVPTDDIHQPLFPDKPPRRLLHGFIRMGWILDERKKRVCWVPLDLRYSVSKCHEKMIALLVGRKVVIIDISGVKS